MVSITTEVEVYMDDFDDEELVAELEGRGYYVSLLPIVTLYRVSMMPGFIRPATLKICSESFVNSI